MGETEWEVLSQQISKKSLAVSLVFLIITLHPERVDKCFVTTTARK